MSRIESEALVVRTVEFGEADLIVTLVTEQAGKMAAIVRGAPQGVEARRRARSSRCTRSRSMLEDKGGGARDAQGGAGRARARRA